MTSHLFTLYRWRAHMRLFACFVFSFLAASAAEPNRAAGERTTASGTITGRVMSAATGVYLNNARVGVPGTTLLVFTDETGVYNLVNVPAGSSVLEISYTGLDTQTIPVEVPAGGTLQQNVRLSKDAGVVAMDTYVVSFSREIAGQALAINEQRYAANIKNVLSADTYGDVTEGNVGEFLKFMPGVAISYGDATAGGVQVRGLADGLTGVTVDGASLAHANLNGDRSFRFSQVSINDVSRVELTKVPTPSTPADSVGGSVNMVSKSAFERSTPELRYRAHLSINGDAFTLKKTPFPYEKETYKARPGFDLSYVKPVNERFGFVVNAASNTQFNVQDYSQPTWNSTGTGTGASPTNPYLQSYAVIDAPKYYYRKSASAKVDWRPRPNSVLSFDVRTSWYRDDNANFSWTASAGTIGTPTPAGGTPMTFGPDFVNGATGRGAVSFAGGHHHITGTLLAENLRYRHDDGTWRVEAGLANSNSTTSNTYAKFGHFQRLNITLREPARIAFSEISGGQPPRIRAFNNSNQEIDLYDLSNYTLNGATNGTNRDIKDDVLAFDASVRRAFSFLPFPAALQAGGSQRIQKRDQQLPTYNYTYNGPGGNQSPLPYASRVYSTNNAFGVSGIPWVSPRYAFEAWQANPSLFTMTPAQMVANETSRITTSGYIEETITAGYMQAEARLFQSRLRVLGGVRYEKTANDGLGPLVEPSAVWVRNPDGSFARNANGDRIRRPEAGAVGSLEQLALTHTRRGYRASRSYDGYYPSVHLTYNATEKLLARLAYAKTYGRPNFGNIIPNTTVDELDVEAGVPGVVPGTITVTNTGLLPWTANNYDFSLEYYTDSGGVLSGGLFRKDITDFFGNLARVATEEDVALLGLDSRYVGWTVRSRINAGDARISGFELNMRQSLGRFGDWGKGLQVFANATKLDLDGGNEADWRGYVPKVVNWGVTFSRRPFTVMAQWNHRGQSQAAPVTTMGPNAFTFEASRTTLDLNLDYQVRRSLSFFINARNVANVKFSTLVYGSETPDYAKIRNLRNYGVQFAIGIKGSF